MNRCESRPMESPPAAAGGLYVQPIKNCQFDLSPQGGGIKIHPLLVLLECPPGPPESSRPMIFTRWFPVLAVCGAMAASLVSAEPKAVPRSPSIESGRAVGDVVPQFYSRVVTGPLMNRSVCYVCRYGERPVVLVVLRQIGPELRPLLKNIDRIVEAHRAKGLRSVGVYLADQSFPAISAVQTFGFNNRIAMPLTVGTEAVATETCQNIAPAAAVTVVLYDKRRVVRKFALRAEELDVERFTPIVTALKSFAADHGAPAPLAATDLDQEPAANDIGAVPNDARLGSP